MVKMQTKTKLKSKTSEMSSVRLMLRYLTGHRLAPRVGVADVAGVAGADGRVQHHPTDGMAPTHTHTRIDTLVADAGLVGEALGVGDALGAAGARRVALEAGEAGAHGAPPDHAALGAHGARRGRAGVSLRRGSCGGARAARLDLSK